MHYYKYPRNAKVTVSCSGISTIHTALFNTLVAITIRRLRVTSNNTVWKPLNVRMNFRMPIEPTRRNKFRLDITIGSFLAVTLILIIARIANKGTPSTRTNTWGIAVVSVNQSGL
jgi:hypothetical protein